MSESTATLNRVILSWPSALSLATTTGTDGVPRSWIQLARTGSFQSSRYGSFDIAADDLRSMAKSFRPGTTPIDYDHLSNDPKRPGDGIAAGWLQRVELRDGGTTLFGLVEWTPDAAKYIANGEYRFISPSFMKNARDAFGNELGTKLLGAALTNFPFLPEMAAVVLGADAVFGQFALSLPPETKAASVISLAELGQRLTFIENEEATPELSPQDRAQVLVVTAIGGGSGDNAFVKLETADSGKPYGWYPLKVLAPAPASAPEGTAQEDTTMMNNIETKAAAFLRRLSKDYTAADVVNLSRQYPDESEAWRLAGLGVTQVEAAPMPTPINLSAREGETFDALCQRHSIEKGISLKRAAHEVGLAYPELAAAR